MTLPGNGRSRSEDLDVEIDRRKIFADTVTRFVLFLVAGVVLVTVAVLLWQIQQLTAIATTNRENGQLVRENSERLVECTTPGGECFNVLRNEEGQAEVIANINEISILAAFCARVPENDTEIEIRTCIEAALADGQ